MYWRITLRELSDCLWVEVGEGTRLRGCEAAHAEKNGDPSPHRSASVVPSVLLLQLKPQPATFWTLY